MSLPAVQVDSLIADLFHRWARAHGYRVVDQVVFSSLVGDVAFHRCDGRMGVLYAIELAVPLDVHDIRWQSQGFTHKYAYPVLGKNAQETIDWLMKN